MAKGYVECELCGKLCIDREAQEHTEETGHNSWTMILEEVMK